MLKKDPKVLKKDPNKLESEMIGIVYIGSLFNY